MRVKETAVEKTLYYMSFSVDFAHRKKYVIFNPMDKPRTYHSPHFLNPRMTTIKVRRHIL